MENVIVILAMYILCFKAKDRRLIYLIGGSCFILQWLYIVDMDIALYYGVSAMVSVVAGVIGITAIDNTSSKVFAIMMVAQSLMCLSLIPSWTYTTNELLQFKLHDFNAILVIILISLGVTSSGIFTKH